ncbi:MAG: YdbL family protein [Steroidobacteraceae bacterium]
MRKTTRTARLAGLTKVVLASMLVAACVTINVYFPAAAAEKAADQIIDAVTGATGASIPVRPSGPPTSNHFDQANPVAVVVGRLLHLLVPAAQAQEANLDISSPEIRAITGSMQARFGQLSKYFDAGVLGMTQSGLIEVRDASAAPLPERAIVNRLVAEDNKDRETLYAEIARANAHPEWAADIRKTFARRWVERGARTGWYYQDPGGAWKQK